MAKATNHDTTKTSEVFREPKLAPERHDEFGQEILDPTPMQPPLGYKKTPSLSEQILQQVRMAKLMDENEDLDETEEEADDFEIGDDYEPLSQYENDHIPKIAVLKEQARKINTAIKKAQNEKAIADYKAKQKAEAPTPGTAPQAEPREASPPAGPALATSEK